MPNPVRRSNAYLWIWLRAAAIAALTWGGMSAMHVGPGWLPAAVGLAAGAVALAHVELGVLLALFGLCVPVIAVNPIAGIMVAIVLFAAEHYLGGEGATRFLLVGLAVAGAALGPVWAAPALAGYLLGAAEGGLLAAAACFVVEIIGLLTARAAIGAAITGGSGTAVVAFAKMPSSLLAPSWIAAAFKTIDTAGVNRLFAAFTHAVSPVSLLLQAVVWVLAAVVAGVITKRSAQGGSPIVMGLAAVSGGVGVALVGDAVVRIGTGIPLNFAASALAAISSLVVAAVVVGLRETVFAPIPAPAVIPAAGPVTMAEEDADVDELLRLIATAEDKLASKHTSQRVVLITDMKSFSRMTEEDGSVATAKAIQRHRDLLVPIITANHGCGKSTGGDGVVAAFESATDAVRAAIEGQRALAEYNTSHPHERELLVRMGLADGEVVLDNGGRPFIGAGLNLAARVMNLADGGQIFASGDVTRAAQPAGATVTPFGSFELKNIAAPVEIGEVLWAEGQVPKDPREGAGA